MTYWLSVVRFVPDPGRGEFINVGAIAGSDDSEEWEARSVANWTRAKHLDARGSLPGVIDFIASLQVQMEVAQESFAPGDERFSLETVRGLVGEMRNIVQVTDPVPVFADSASAAIDLAFKEIVLDPEPRTYSYQRKHGAVKATKLAYKNLGIEPLRDVSVRTGPYDMKFDFAVANGKARQLVRCWSFDLLKQRELSEEIKAWAWSVRSLRTHGQATLFATTSQTRVEPDVDVEVVYVPPSDGQKSEAFEVAMDAFAAQGVEVTAVQQDKADMVAARAAQYLGLPLQE